MAENLEMYSHCLKPFMENLTDLPDKDEYSKLKPLVVSVLLTHSLRGLDDNRKYVAMKGKLAGITAKRQPVIANVVRPDFTGQTSAA